MATTETKKEKISVKLDNPKTALKTVGEAIQSMLASSSDIVTKAMAQDYKSHALIATLQNQLNLAGAALNGPAVGLKMPSVGDIFGPLRSWMQDNYPTLESENPFLSPVGKTPYRPFVPATPASLALDLKEFVKSKNDIARLQSIYRQPVKVIERILWVIDQNATLKKLKNSDFTSGTPQTDIDKNQKTFETAVYADLKNYCQAGYDVQQTFFALLKDDLDAAIKVFDKLGTNPYLAEAELSYLQASVMKAIPMKLQDYPGFLGKAKVIMNGEAKDPNSHEGIFYTIYGPDPLPDPANRDIKDVLDKNFLREVEENFMNALEGPNNGVFPPPGGENFLSNLEKLILNNLDDVPGMKHTRRSAQQGIASVLMNNLVNLGSQGSLLTDTYDTELTSSLKSHITHLFNRLDDIKEEVTDGMNLALGTSQSILASLSAVTNFVTEWESVEVALKSNQNMSVGDNKGLSSTALSAIMNGSDKKTPNGDYLLALIDHPTDGIGILEETENLNTIIAGQMGGLNYVATALLNKQGGISKADELAKMVGDQFTRSLKKLESDLNSYTEILNNYLTAKADTEETEDIIEGTMGVEDIIHAATKIGSPALVFTDAK
ncbi:MAG: hypothetical protein H6581_15855 [Bacteroidia bacterium]|nr:hypothetical protein [Bacteroidia bacterium]